MVTGLDHQKPVGVHEVEVNVHLFAEEHHVTSRNLPQLFP